MINRKLETIINEFDKLADELYIASKNNDTTKLDHVGREMRYLGAVLKDTAYEMRREVGHE